MNATITDDHRPFRLDPPWRGPLLAKLAAVAGTSLERLTALSGLNDVYRRAAHAPDRRAFLDAVLKDLRVTCEVADADLDRIPRKGPVVVVANHPFGAIEGIVLVDLLTRVRPDVKVMANYLLGSIPELRDLLIFVNPFGGGRAAAHGNVAAMRQCLNLLGNGGLLAVFPAGEVSSLDLRKRQVTDRSWSPMVARLVRRTGAAVVPVFFNGRNGAAFQVAGLVHPRLRTALLPRQLLNKRDSTLDVRIGSAIPGRKLKTIEGDDALTQYLRQRTYVLKHRGAGEVTAVSGGQTPRIMRPVVAIGDVSAMVKEIEALAPDQRLVEADDNLVALAPAAQVPSLMREIGRLREITFRAAAEGTGKPIDLDAFDSHYLHLIVWNRPRREIVGSYRLGLSDQIIAERGVAGLYTYELFDYRREMLEGMGPALELGRSFVRPEYQRSFTPLLLLWKGIGRFLVDHPRYRYLFGPVSISGAYQSASVRLMVQFLQMHHGASDAESSAVSARTPFVAPPLRGWDDRDAGALARDEDDLSDLVADLEVDQKGVPVLIRQYLKLGARFLSFNVDRAFGDCVDGLILVDLPRADRRVTERYLGKQGLPKYLAHHRAAGLAV
ncbi:MAG TPA: GNAT family N-acyltransferase [Tepidisphaeraceae bacterium]